MRRRAFTLIELLVILAIIGILTAVSFVSYASAKNKKSVKVQAQQIRDIIAEARSLSIAPPTTFGTIDLVNIDEVEAKMFNSPTRVEIYIAYNHDPGTTVLYRTYSNFKNVKFDFTGASADDHYNVKFNPNYGELIGPPTPSDKVVKIQSSSGTDKYEIDVNDFGVSTITPIP